MNLNLCFTCSWDDPIASGYEKLFQDCVRKMVEDPMKRTKIMLDAQSYKSILGNFASIEASQALDQTESSKLFIN